MAIISAPSGGVKLIQRGSFAATNTSGQIGGVIALPVVGDISKTVLTHFQSVNTLDYIISNGAGFISGGATIHAYGNAGGATKPIAIKWEIKEDK